MKLADKPGLASAHNPHGDGSYIPMLDGWRAVAILLVILFHGTYNTNLSGSPRLQAAGQIAGRTGALGVLIFFCISGYLITGRLLVESRASGMFSMRAFYIKRAFRIFPPLILYLLVAVILFWAGVIQLSSRDWSAPLFMANYFQGSWYTSHFWSLSVEEHFYLFWPICIFLAGWRRAMWVGVGLICAVALWRPWALQHSTLKAATLQHTDVRMDYIMMGAVVALASEFYPWTLPTLKKIGTLPGLAVMFVLLLASTLPGLPIDLRSVQAILLTLIVCASVIARAPVIRALLANRPILFLGKISYSLYIWQQLYLGATKYQFWSSLSALPIKYGAAVATAYVSYRFVEKPFIRTGRALLMRSSAETPILR